MTPSEKLEAIKLLISVWQINHIENPDLMVDAEKILELIVKVIEEQ